MNTHAKGIPTKHAVIIPINSRKIGTCSFDDIPNIPDMFEDIPDIPFIPDVFEDIPGIVLVCAV